MKTVILAGGYGTRLSEESRFKPKPMLEIGGMPMLWHIMKGYSTQGFNEFVICAGYKQHMIKEWFADYFLHTSDITFDFTNDGEMTIHDKHVEPWRVTIVDTGLDTQTGGRIKRLSKYLQGERFMLTYGDGVGDLDLQALIEDHEKSGKTVTLSVYNFGQNKGVLDVDSDGTVNAFREKSDLDGDLINIGFMVCEPQVLELIEDDATVFEQGPLRELVAQQQLNAYVHSGFWQCMDTLREKQHLEQLWDSGHAPWKTWGVDDA